MREHSGYVEFGELASEKRVPYGARQAADEAEPEVRQVPERLSDVDRGIKRTWTSQITCKFVLFKYELIVFFLNTMKVEWRLSY